MSSPSKRNLFFPADSDSEEDEVVANGHDSGSEQPRQREALFIPDDEDDIVVVGSTLRTSPGPSSSKPVTSSPLPPSSSAGPSKPTKRSTSSSQTHSSVRPGFTRGYLGEFVCEGWSLSKGKGYCSPGSRVIFERPKAKKGDNPVGPDTSAKLGPARLVNGKVVHAKAKIGGKQMTLGAMIKKAPVAAVSALRSCEGRC